MKKYFLLISLFLLKLVLFSQKGMFKIGVKQFNKGNYEKALEKFFIVYSYDSLNYNLNYLIGTCYFYMNNFNKAIQFLKFSAEKLTKNYKGFYYNEKNAPLDALLVLGKAYHLSYRFDLSIETLKNYISMIDSTTDRAKYLEAILWLNYSLNALLFVNDTSELIIENIGKAINTEYNEISPVVNIKEENLFFSSDRKIKDVYKRNKSDFNIYFSKYYKKKWTKPEYINLLNTNFNEMPLCISNDGTELYVCRNENNDHNIYVSYYLDSMWSIPVKLNDFINSKHNEYCATISSDKQILIFSSTRNGGIGGKDLYISKRLPNGEWGIPINLGKVLNTEYDEDCPFLSPDGLTLYFSSNCKKSMGGYDLFVSHLINDSMWSEPQNLGYPINTVEDELFFYITADEKNAYFSAHRDDSYGGKDIYMMNLLSLPEKSYIIVKGKIYLSGNSEFIKDIVINVFDLKKGIMVGKFKPNKITGNYVLVLKKNHKYSLICETDNWVFEPQIIEFKLDEESEIEYSIVLNPLGKSEKNK
ncbi:MAG: hypothetical protein N3A01_01585 [Bacteroidales bacterium]|nr:hypothetical protein [Bacteroidales bacterium]